MMSFNPASAKAKKTQQASPTAMTQPGMANTSDVVPYDLLMQGGLSPLVLGGDLRQLMQSKVGDNALLQQLMAGMNGSGLFGQ